MRTGDHVLAMVNDLQLIFGKGPDGLLMSTHASTLVDYVGPPSAEVCRTAAISLKWMT